MLLWPVYKDRHGPTVFRTSKYLPLTRIAHEQESTLIESLIVLISTCTPSSYFTLTHVVFLQNKE